LKLNLVINGSEAEMDMISPAPHCRFRFAGRELCADVQMPEPRIYSVLVDGHSYDASVERTEQALIVTVDGHRFEIEVRDPRRWARWCAYSWRLAMPSSRDRASWWWRP